MYQDNVGMVQTEKVVAKRVDNLDGSSMTGVAHHLNATTPAMYLGPMNSKGEVTMGH
jgi:hypothetical protein